MNSAQPMRITEYNVVQNMKDSATGEREITTGCVRFYLSPSRYFEVKPSRYHADRIEIHMSGEAGLNQIEVFPKVSNAIEIGTGRD